MDDGEGDEFASTAGCRSSDSRPVASDSEEEMMERSDAIDLRGSATCSRGGDGGWSSIGGSSCAAILGVTAKVEGGKICSTPGGGGSSASTIVVEPELFVRLCFLPDTSDMRRTPLMNPR